MIRVVLDTNIVISAFFWKGYPYELLKLVIAGRLINITSLSILEEVYQKLKAKFNVPTEKVNSLIKILFFNSQIIYPEIKINIVKNDPSDNKIIECAVAGMASFIISGDTHLLTMRNYQNIKIISPREFIKWFDDEEKRY